MQRANLQCKEPKRQQQRERNAVDEQSESTQRPFGRWERGAEETSPDQTPDGEHVACQETDGSQTVDGVESDVRTKVDKGE